MDEEKLLDEYLQKFGYKPERDVNGYREIIRKSYDFQLYIGQSVLNIFLKKLLKHVSKIIKKDLEEKS